MSLADELRQGLIARGLPPHAAEGVLMNFRDESGLNPGINEIAPTVPGSRGGFGLAQWTGPRRVALERFAAERGASPADHNLQLDFLMAELQGPERKAYNSLMAASSPGEAAAAFVRDFERPAAEHLERRTANYLGGYADDAGVSPRNALAGAQEPPAERLNALAALTEDRRPDMPRFATLDPRMFMSRRSFV